MNINNAILHVFDFVSCVNVFAQAPMDLGNKAAKRYVTSQAKRALGNLDSKRGTFAENSLFAEELRSYFRGERDFVGLSQQIGEFIVGELSRMEKTPSTDLLVVDFEGDADQTVREMTDEEAEAAYKAQGPRYFAIILLESRQAYMHEVGSNDFGDTATTIARHHAILPNPSQKVASFALISADDMAVWFVDKEREIAGEKRWIIPDGLLQCSMEASSREVLEAVTTVVEEVAEVFADQPRVAERFDRAVEEGALPERVVVEKAVAKRVTKSHKIRTDTGIELTFPAEYGENSDFIEFFSTPDGRIEIALKNIGAIENR